jgi:Trk K+ transport system NAD-binding subunit
MPAVIDDQNFYRIAEGCRMIGISRNTLFTWLKERIIPDVEYRVRRGWRLFTLAQTETIGAKTRHITVTSRER